MDREEELIRQSLGRERLDPGEPFLRKSAAFVSLAGRMAAIRAKYRITDADWEMLASDWIELVISIQNPANRV